MTTDAPASLADLNIPAFPLGASIHEVQMQAYWELQEKYLPIPADADTVLVEWIGEPTEWIYLTDDQGNLLYTPNGDYVREVDHDKEGSREAVLPGVSRRFQCPHDPPGFSRYYQWGPHKYVIRMLRQDWLGLMTSGNGYRFRAVGE